MKEADVCLGFGDLKSVFHLGRGGVPLPVSLSRAQVSKAIHFIHIVSSSKDLKLLVHA